MGFWFSSCFTHKEKSSDRCNPEKEAEEENNHHHHEQGNRGESALPYQSINVVANRISNCDLSERLSEGDENKHHEEQSSTPSCDRISDLPDDILHLILSFLPDFKAIGQTSVLSKRWGHVWSSYPILDFYDIVTGNEAIHHQTRARIINTILVPHDENYNIMYPCCKIPLTSYRLGQFQRDMGDRNHLCLARVEELVLDISLRSENKSHDLPRCQLKCHSLKSCSCRGSSTPWLEFPSTYIVWSYLLSLQDVSLKYVNFRDGALDTNLCFGFSFPFLKQLSITCCKGITALKICCPNLQDLSISRMDLYSMDISAMRLGMLYSFANSIEGWVKIFAPNLQSLYWGNYNTEKCSIQSFPTPKTSSGLSGTRSIATPKICHKSFITLLSHSSQAKIISLSTSYLEILSEIYSEFGRLPFSFGKLETLRIRIKQRYLPVFVSLLKISPVVHTLEISSLDEDDKWNNKLLKTQARYWSPFLIRLKVVEIYLGKIISENAISFVKFMLQYGGDLQNIILIFWRSKSSLPPNSLDDTIARLKAFPRASANVKFSTRCY